MADSTSLSPESSSKRDKGNENQKEKPEKQNQESQGNEDEQQDGEATAEGEEGTRSDTASRPFRAAEVEKETIADDFFYDVEELWSKPVKSDENLPDDLLTLFHSFGYQCRMRNNLHALDEHRLIFAAGAYLQIVTMDGAPFSYEFLPTTGGGAIGCLALHPLGNLFAVGEKSSSPTVNIFTVEDYRLYRILRNATTHSLLAISFNETGELLASQGADPDFILTVWNWQQEAILLRTKAFSQEINHVSFNRDLRGALTTSGVGHIKFWNMARTFTGLKLQGSVGRFGKTAISDIEGYIEFPDGKVLSGSDWGNMLLWDENLVKLQIGRKNGKPCHLGAIMQMMMVEGEIITAGMDGFVRSWNYELVDMLETDEQSGLVEIEAMNEVLVGLGAQLYYLTQPPVNRGEAKKAPDDEPVQERSVHNHMWFCQDGSGGIWYADLSFSLAAMPPKRLLRFHSGAIVACAVSPVTYLLMTLGEDGSLRLYDLLKKMLLAVKHFKANGSALVWIPLCVDNRCATVQAGFSDGGIRRVAVDGVVTTVFGVDHVECQLKLLQAMRPHDKPVTALAYSVNVAPDSKHLSRLATCSEDKTVFLFEVLAEDNYIPLCFVPLLEVPRHVVWSPDVQTSDHMLLTCDGGLVVEMVAPASVDQTETLECRIVMQRVCKFHSVKSEILHEEELRKEAEMEEKRREQEEENNKMMLLRGLETPSQQELRLEQERAHALALRKAREETEEPWKPYIPPTPSPILQTVYTEANTTFWLMFGGYDAGFLYECKFPQPFRSWGKEEEVEVERIQLLNPVRVVDAEDQAISAMCFNSDGTCVFFGMQNGRIRLQFLETEFDLASPRCHWCIAAHDNTNGAITGMRLSHDETFLVTVGADGNIFVFSLVPLHQLRDAVRDRQAKIPVGVGTQGEEGEAEVDLTPNQYTIEQAKQKTDYDHMVMLAERNKHNKRVEIAKLRAHFKRLLDANLSMPAQHRLTSDEFVLEPSLIEDLKREKTRKVELLRLETAWTQAKIQLGYQKLYDHYLHNMLTDRFCVRAFGSDHIIYSFRTEKRVGGKTSLKMQKSSIVSSDHWDEDKTDESLDESDEHLKQLIINAKNLPDLTGASKRTIYLLKKAAEKRVARARRNIEWRKFMETKPSEDFEDPDDVEAMKKAYCTMGDRHLKSDSSYVVPDSYRLTIDAGAKRLSDCGKHLLALKHRFNRRLESLRRDKLRALDELHKASSRLQEIQDDLDFDCLEIIPTFPDPCTDEEPGGRFALDTTEVENMRREARDKVKRESVSAETGYKDALFHNKSRRRSSVAIAKENYSRRKTVSMTTDSDTKIETSEPSGSSKPKRKRDRPEDQSPLEKELAEVKQIELLYEQSTLTKKMEKIKAVFNIHHRQLRHEKFQLDVSDKLGQLRINTLQEELLLLMECESVETGIQARIDKCTEQRAEIERMVKQLQAQITKHGKELEDCTKKEKALYEQLEQIIGEGNNFHDFLVKVFKKKVKRKNLQAKAEDDDEESSESESDSSESDEESDEDDDDFVHLDLGSCPKDCSESVYKEVVDLREQRLDLDEVTTEVKRAREALTKDLEACTKKRQVADATYNKAAQELKAFQLEKQKRINALDVQCTLHLHQIQCLRRSGEFTGITDELCINEDEVLRLQNRIRELKKEKIEVKEEKVKRRKQHVHLQYAKTLFLEKLAEMNERCNKEMCCKFGKIVDIEVLEGVTADPHLEDIRARLVRSQLLSDVEIRKMKKAESDMHELNVNSVRLDSDYKMMEANLKARCMALSQNLDAMIKAKPTFQDDNLPEVPKDIEDILDVVGEQREIIRALMAEIHLLERGAAPSHH